MNAARQVNTSTLTGLGASWPQASVWEGLDPVVEGGAVIGAAREPGQSCADLHWLGLSSGQPCGTLCGRNAGSDTLIAKGCAALQAG